MDSGLIIFKYGKPSPLEIIGLSFFTGAFLLLTLPILAVILVILAASTAYITWRAKKVLDAYEAERARFCKSCYEQNRRPRQDILRTVVIDITPEGPSSYKKTGDLPVLPHPSSL